MKILMVTAHENRGIELAEILSNQFDVFVLHEGKIDEEYHFAESEINSLTFSDFPFGEYPLILYMASEKLPCRYLTSVLQALNENPQSRCICISESSISPIYSQVNNPEKYICRGFQEQLSGRLSYLSTYPVYGDDFFPEEIMITATERIKSNRILLPGAQDQVFDILHIADLAKAITCISEKENLEPELFLSGNQQSSLKELGDALHGMFPQTNIEYSNHPDTKPAEQKPGQIKGWMPEHSFTADLPSVVKRIEQKGKNLLWTKRSNRSNKAIRLISFLGLFALVCLYTGFIRINSGLQYVDVRLLFIVSACLFWDSQYGLAAGILCSIASVFQSILSGTQWHVIFFHIDNWIPIAVYLAAAVLFGMYRNNHKTGKNNPLPDDD